ncbi:hypothetical protein [Cytobacillus sp. NCCP-133]|uniref:hypothetical protein n=1 Tax=Cytobacillus sp. NCCP-133 TaxID=766848 RepID=UPI00223213B5|nr:hypothetical protein [Cytobacillus sp. NCCP-133]
MRKKGRVEGLQQQLLQISAAINQANNGLTKLQGGGTFAAMMSSGMLSLVQIASIVLVGLMLYALVMLPLFIPVMVKNFGQAN